MRVLFDHNVPKKLRSLLSGHSISTSPEMGWDTLKNGDLLAAAQVSGFEVMVTGDKNISYQQNLAGRKLALIVLPTTNWGTLQQNYVRNRCSARRGNAGKFLYINSYIWHFA